ncbi:hypothetical protein IAG41_20850 [Sphingomonas sp. JC676]|uniref:hypothetical protein n=1 Tax=Sphingomonas sp. JC676 TaxID=2768065 RepID=UPI0016578AEB|nr:hypothetical protein [Sphingomonas sp. JC676]MBC9034847.1 hypothetical protein [Sphingomonas sp. JC676]
MGEMLIILAKGRTAAELEGLATVRQRYGDRVFVVAAAEPAPLGALGDVFPADSKAPESDESLSTTEQLGISAWNAREDLANKQRPGEGLDWDSEGFEAP